MGDRVCLYPGSFDPVTRGHMDIIARTAKIFDQVVVGVLHNPDKKGCFPVEKRVEMLEKACRDIKNVRVASSTGLTAVFAKEMGACVLVRGVRNQLDLESENDMAHINGMLVEEMETVYLPASLEKSNISSTYVRQLASFGADITPFVPMEVRDDIIRTFRK